MKPEGNPLDLNNLPEDNYAKDAKIAPEDTSSSAVCRKKKSGGKEAAKKDEASKVYECRFCSLKFCKSQALGGHMNRHRQERETETLHKARQLVFTSDLAPTTHLGYVSAGQPIQQPPPRLFPPVRAPSQYLYASSPRVLSFPSQTRAVRDYYVGHALSNGSYGGEGNSYSCVGAPVGQGIAAGGCGGGGGGGGVRDVSLQNDVEEGVRWGRR